MQGGSSVIVGSSWCVMLLHRTVHCLPCRPVGDVAPVSGCEKRLRKGSAYLLERTRKVGGHTEWEISSVGGQVDYDCLCHCVCQAPKGS